MIVLESNQNHAVAADTEVCPTLPAAMGMGGGYIPMIVDTLVFDESQITCPTNGLHPRWGGAVPLPHEGSGQDGHHNQKE